MGRQRNDAFIRWVKEGVPCHDCGEWYPYFVMDFDHRDPAEKRHNISVTGRSQAGPLLMEEILKCDVVCSNCHRQRSHQRRLGE